MKISPVEAVSTIKLRLGLAAVQATGKEAHTYSEWLEHREAITEVDGEWNRLSKDENYELSKVAHTVAHDFIDMMMAMLIHEAHEDGSHEVELDPSKLCSLMASMGRVMYEAGLYAGEGESAPYEDPILDPTKFMMMSRAVNSWKSWAATLDHAPGDDSLDTAIAFNANLLSTMIPGMPEDQALQAMEDMGNTARMTLAASIMILDEPPEGEEKDFFGAACAAMTVSFLAGIWATMKWVKP